MARFIGLDIGGTRIRGALASVAGRSKPRILREISIPTPKGSRAVVIGAIADVVAQLHSSGKGVDGIGVGIVGFLKDGVLHETPNIPSLEGSRAGELLIKQLRSMGIRAPVKFENDSKCFALAEWLFGAGRGCRHMVGIIVGTGIGSGLILDGKLYRGRDGGAGNIGHTTIDPSGSKCGCGHFGHFESWCSGKHIVKRYVAAGGRTAAPHPARIFASRDPVAMNVMAETYDKFGLGLANVVNTLNPEIIVLGGGVSNLPGPFYKSLRSALRRHGNPAMSSVKIIRGKLGDSAGILGAVAVAAGY